MFCLTCKALVTFTNKGVWSYIAAVTIETCMWLALSNNFCTIFTYLKGVIRTLNLINFFLNISNIYAK